MKSRPVLQTSNAINLRHQITDECGREIGVKHEELHITNYFNIRKRRSTEGLDVKSSCAKQLHIGGSVTTTKNYFSSLALDEQKREELVTPLEPTPLGIFTSLPLELLQTLLDFIPLKSLCVLCRCSEGFTREIRSYLTSPLAQRRFATEALNCIYSSNSNFDHFCSWGALINAATEAFPLSFRLYILSNFYVKNINVEHCAKGWGRLFYVIYEKLDCKQRLEFMDKVFAMDSNSLKNLLNMVLEGLPGAFPNCEMKVRRMIRGFFLETSRCSNVNEVAFWMSAVIRTQKSSASRARLIFLLYGPLKNGGEEMVDWRILVDTAISTYNENIGCLKPLSDALYFLASSKFLPECHAELSWSETEMFNVIEELTTSPEPWCFDNFASLILHRPCLIPLTFVPRVMNGFVDEAGQLFNTMKTLLYRWRMSGLKHLGRYIEYSMEAMPPTERCIFVAAVHRAFSNQLQDHLSAVPAAQVAFGEEIKAARSNSPLLKLIERFV